MPRALLRFDAVSFAYDSSAELLLNEVSLTFAAGWTGIVGANGSGKTTLLRIALGEQSPVAGKVVGPKDCVLCEQRTDAPPDGLERFLASVEPADCVLRGLLQLGSDWSERWLSLSPGERKRAQVAVALARKPTVLALDEPTNHLDEEANSLLRRALLTYDGVGLLVSHDRELLDRLCYQCVFVDPPKAILRPGGYSAGAEQARLERESLCRARAHADREWKALRREANRRRDQELKAERQRSRRGVDKKDHDAKARINLARLTDGGSGQRLRQLDGRIDRAGDRKEQLRVPKEVILGVSIPGQRAPRKHVVTIEPCNLSLGPERSLSVPALVVSPQDRIAVTGPNGIGKTTLLKHLLAQAQLPSSRLAYLPQEIEQERAATILCEFRALPSEQLGRALSLVHRLGSSPQRLLETEAPSPGEVRKMLLSLGLVSEPFLVVLDEPTNHLDLPSIECLEEALAQCEAALVLVSHDARFRERLAHSTWRIELREGGSELTTHLKACPGVDLLEQ